MNRLTRLNLGRKPNSSGLTRTILNLKGGTILAIADTDKIEKLLLAKTAYSIHQILEARETTISESMLQRYKNSVQQGYEGKKKTEITCMSLEHAISLTKLAEELFI